jgi:hypothetical protein
VAWTCPGWRPPSPAGAGGIENSRGRLGCVRCGRMSHLKPIGLWLVARLFTTVLSGCGSEFTEAPLQSLPCGGLQVQLLNEVTTPPANVSTLLRVNDCHGEPLPEVLDDTHFTLAEENLTLSAFEAERLVRLADRGTSERTVLVLDLSGSITDSGVKPAMVDGAETLTTALLQDGHEVAVYGFDGRPDLVPFQRFTADESALQDAFARVRVAETIDNSTNLYGAIVNALRVLDESVLVAQQDDLQIAQGSLVFFTDGSDRAGRVSRTAVSQALDTTVHATIALGIGPEIDDAFLSDLGRTAARHIDDVQDVVQTFEEISVLLRAQAAQDYIISYCSPSRAGVRELSILVSYQDQTALQRLSFNADGFGAGCSPEDTPLR